MAPPNRRLGECKNTLQGLQRVFFDSASGKIASVCFAAGVYSLGSRRRG